MKATAHTPSIRFKGFVGDWERRTLGTLMTVTSVKRIHQSDWTSSGIRFLRARDIVSKSKNEEPDDFLYISKEKYDEYSITSGKVTIGDILVTGVGTIGVPYLVENLEPIYFKDGNIIWFQNSLKINGDFFYYSFRAHSIQKFINESAGTGTVGTYTIESGQKTPIALPEKKEQKKVGGYFKNLDTLIALQQQKHEKLQNVKKAMLASMFPAPGATTPAVRFAGFSAPWRKINLGEYSESIIAGGTPSTQVASYWEPKEVPWLSSGEVHKKRIEFTDNKISKKGLNNSSARWIKEHSVLIALAGQGKTRGTVAINYIPLTTNQSIAAIIPISKLYYEFLFQNLESRYEELRMLSSPDGSRGGLNKQILTDLFMYIPEKDEQVKIGEYLSKLDNLIMLQKSKLEKLQCVKKACLERMFV